MSTIQAKNINHPNYQENLKEEKYTIIREAMLASLPASGDGESMTFIELEEKVRAYLVTKGVPSTLFPKSGSVRWYVKAVQLDLESRNEIERVPNQSPIRLRLSVTQ